MSDGATNKWEVVASLPDAPSAQVVALRLDTRGVPARVESGIPFLGQGQASRVLVPADYLPRARSILAEPLPSEAELNDLATGDSG